MIVTELYKSIRADKDKVYLLLQLFGLSSTDLLITERELTKAELESWQQHCQKLDSGMPLAYVLGTAPFGPYEYKVTPDVLIPRECTYLLVEQALSCGQEHAVVLDVGTGSGCIAASIQQQKPNWHVVGIDISDKALEVAASNGVTNLLKSDFLSEVEDNFADIIVSNPPYIKQGDERVEDSVHNYEPHTALYLGDGLDAYRHLAEQAARVLKSGGMLAMEFGQGQEDAIVPLLAGYQNIHIINDLDNIPRIISCQKV